MIFSGISSYFHRILSILYSSTLSQQHIFSLYSFSAIFTVYAVSDVRVGLDVVRDPSFIVTRAMEDHVTWSDKSAVREKVLDFRNARDDYELNGE